MGQEPPTQAASSLHSVRTSLSPLPSCQNSAQSRLVPILRPWNDVQSPQTRLFHIVSPNDWQAAARRGSYEPASLGTEGFIHCSAAHQIIETANRWYRGQSDLLLLAIAPDQLTAPVKLEPPANPADERRGEFFPHIYGPLNLDAVEQVIEFPCERDGTFRAPRALRL